MSQERVDAHNKPSTLLSLIADGRLDGVAYEVEPMYSYETRIEALSCIAFEGVSRAVSITQGSPRDLSWTFELLSLADHEVIIPGKTSMLCEGIEEITDLIGDDCLILHDPRLYDPDINGFGYVFDGDEVTRSVDFAVPYEGLRVFEYIGNVPLTQTYAPGRSNTVSPHRSDNWRKPTDFKFQNAMDRPDHLNIIDTSST